MGHGSTYFSTTSKGRFGAECPISASLAGSVSLRATTKVFWSITASYCLRSSSRLTLLTACLGTSQGRRRQSPVVALCFTEGLASFSMSPSLACEFCGFRYKMSRILQSSRTKGNEPGGTTKEETKISRQTGGYTRRLNGTPAFELCTCMALFWVYV
ncbi:conserved hypothetical protein [Coccidioides posadasii str. Silveira]|uniref:Uncharacterized protein n=2 Tax=Coccidioides posadasii TaxID=199306 RepID=E9D0R4_COCPS|nr:conserved hypothetical protein [Coccidioides posadasii str. Silveira]KMM73513.1 hypothetical protein CPAG_09801 [Coccidioides posadasii RMSCC 3488]